MYVLLPTEEVRYSWLLNIFWRVVFPAQPGRKASPTLYTYSPNSPIYHITCISHYDVLHTQNMSVSAHTM